MARGTAKKRDPDKALTVRAMYAPVSSLDTCGKLPHVTGMSASIRLNDELIAAAKRQAKLFHRSPPQQI